MNKSIFWYRQDLRIEDNPGLETAIAEGSVMAVFILDQHLMGSASNWWLHHSLTSLNRSLNGCLNVYIGDSLTIIKELVTKHQIDKVFWNRCYEPERIKSDSLIKSSLIKMGVEAKSFNGSLLWEPWEVTKPDKTYYKIFTFYYRNGCLKKEEPICANGIPNLSGLIKDHENQITIDDLGLLPKKGWADNFYWQVGEEAASQKLQYFLNHKLGGYKENRNYPGLDATSKLSPHLHFGEISPNQIWCAAKNYPAGDDLNCFLSELVWREFSYYLLYHFPDLANSNFQNKFDRFPWKNNMDHLKLWQKGQTGIPIVDAGMRELWQTGYMHNRVRMIVGSFLVKNLLIDWRYGKKWFEDCLVDADLASNSASWQWVAGTGADAAPYYRIFNPVLQGEKFDKDGVYTKKYVPELAKLPSKYLFKPWEAPDLVLKEAGVKLGMNYPHPIVDLSESRKMALELYKS
ncbi:Deoxyribodipyrimidine photo-lyase [Candidatus Arcanobacter lacustris]|uniref:Deoxyribodipyrimidine photo-lyase n=1 Tax=Candidatus Arcanibacter lacustris TaxID=1607817 RepID=A0A0F5MN16_9RICK|nr:Deoxyribodipyrimidine photo-lyase [Candidatus Arcanobacter lacustris]